MSDLSLTFDGRPLRLSPTDLSTFVRLEQCERFLRLRLFEHEQGRGFYTAYGVQPQRMSELLTRSGRRFEEEVEEGVSQRFSAVNLAAPRPVASRETDNARLLEEIAALPPGGIRVLFQPRLEVTTDRWRLRGEPGPSPAGTSS